MDHQAMVDLARDIYRQDPFLRFASMFRPMKADGYSKIRTGSPADGGYVMLDDFKNIEMAISLGVDINADWDLDVAKRGIRVQQYDFTVLAPPIIHELIQFEPLKIVPIKTDSTNTSISNILNEANIHQDASALLKIDIEGDEWLVFDACKAQELRKFSQILVEFHNISHARDFNWLRGATDIMKKISDDFGVVHVHANNWSPMAVIGNVYFPDTLEVSFANRTRYSLVSTDELFPGILDAPNNPILPDLYLGSFRYSAKNTSE